MMEYDIVNVLIVGLGSMGKRRARLIHSLYPEFTLYGVDTNEERRDQFREMGWNSFPDLESALDGTVGYDAALVCTAPLTHGQIIHRLLSAGLPVFSEINLVDDGYEENLFLAKKNDLPLFLSSTMLYRKEIQRMKEAVEAFREEKGQPVNYIYHIGQYLPDWHPWETYQNFFVADRRTGGVREILGIDLPWLVDTFGDAQVLHVENNRLSQLEITYPDAITVLLRHDSGTVGTLVVDVVSPKATRHFECFGEGLHLLWDGSPKELSFFDPNTKTMQPINAYEHFEQDARYSDNIVETAYADELIDFFSLLAGDGKPLWSFEKDRAVIDLMNQIDSLEEST